MNAKPETISWHERARSLSLRTQAFIDGRYVDAASGATFDSHQPGHRQAAGARCLGRHRGHQPRGGRGARGVSQGQLGQSCRPPSASACCSALRSSSQAHRGARAARDARHGQAHHRQPERRHPRRGALHPVVCRGHRQDLRRSGAHGSGGPCDRSRASPWAWSGRSCRGIFRCSWLPGKSAPILAAGNSLVLKPSEKSPLTALAVARACGRGRHSPGRVQRGARSSARPPARRWRCTWTSTASPLPARPPPASTIMQYAGQSNLKRVSLECGGKSPNIVMADYPDLEKAATAAAYRHLLQPGRGVFGRLAPAACRKASRMRSWRKCRRSARTMQPGDPLDAGDALGAIVDETQMKRVLGYIDAGRARRRQRALWWPPRARGQRRLLHRADRVRGRVARR